MKRWYADDILVQHYVQAYRDLLERPDLFSRAREVDLAAHWRNVKLPDLIWDARRQCAVGCGAEVTASLIKVERNA
jgi:hypothetical protein